MHQPHPAPRARLAPRHHFTFVELLIVVAILLILAALLMPALSRALGQARRTVCVSNMQQLAVAWLAFLPDHGGTFVSAYSGAWVGGGESLESVTGGQLGP